jgi:hypothetical protein
VWFLAGSRPAFFSPIPFPLLFAIHLMQWREWSRTQISTTGIHYLPACRVSRAADSRRANSRINSFGMQSINYSMPFARFAAACWRRRETSASRRLLLADFQLFDHS